MRNFLLKFKKIFGINNYRRAWIVLNNEGFKSLIIKVKNKISLKGSCYEDWLKQHIPSIEELSQQRLIEFNYQPLISFVCPVYNTDLRLLKEMINSVREQTYSNWELCIANGSINNYEIDNLLQHFADKDPRIKYANLNKNLGISGNSNEALKIAVGDYIGLIDHDDVLSPNALYEIVLALQDIRHDLIYSDEDFISEDSKKYSAPSFKPDWSPDLFCTHNYITHFACIKAELIKKVGGFDSAFDGAQDYDLFFKCTEIADSIYHVSKILYHWRICETSVASDSKNKLYAYDAGKRAIQSHLERCNLKGEVSMMNTLGYYHVIYNTLDNPLVSIIIPNKDHVRELRRCINSLEKLNAYKNVEIIVCENNSKKKSTFKYYDQISTKYKNIRILKYSKSNFNYSLINNFAAKKAKGKYLLFLNNDTKIINPQSIAYMVGLCQVPHIGIVGSKLLYRDKSVQHAGVVLGFGGAAGHVFHGISNNFPGYKMRAFLTCNYNAVTAACLMISKDLFLKVRGFDERYRVAYNDVDLCLKVRALGKYIVYEPDSLWFHYESKSRGYEDTPEKLERVNSEIKLLQKKWGEKISDSDEFYNRNFAMDCTPFYLRQKNDICTIDYEENLMTPLSIFDHQNRKLFIDRIYYKYNNNSIHFYGWCTLPDRNLAIESDNINIVDRNDLIADSTNLFKVGFVKKIKLDNPILGYFEFNIFNIYKIRISLKAIEKLIDQSNNMNNNVDKFYGTNLLETSVSEYQRNRYKEINIAMLNNNFNNNDKNVYLFDIDDRKEFGKIKNIKSKWVIFKDGRISLSSDFQVDNIIESKFNAVVFSYQAFYNGQFVCKVQRNKESFFSESNSYALYAVAIRSEELRDCSSVQDILALLKKYKINKDITFIDQPGYILNLKLGTRTLNNLVAFYLPQFHETPYNNKWWGQGFTEWDNVRRATAMYKGHNQPRKPRELGYYDLSDFRNQIKQISIAKKYNIYGFCYYYYWFDGKRLLEKPLNDFLSHKDVKFPFCICWANETWSRRWDGQDHDILMQQNHNEKTDLKFILDIIPILKDDRYINIEGSPVLLIYRANLFENPRRTFSLWRKICTENGIPSIKIGIVQSFLSIDHNEYGADFSVEFPPHKVASSEEDCTNLKPNNDFSGILYSYKDLVDHQELISKANYELKPGIMLEWDNTARKMNDSIIYTNFSLDSYKKWAIKNQLYNLIFNKDNISFINAWNEWAEGSYLEPDKKYGTKLLEITDEVLKIY